MLTALPGKLYKLSISTHTLYKHVFFCHGSHGSSHSGRNKNL